MKTIQTLECLLTLSTAHWLGGVRRTAAALLTALLTMVAQTTWADGLAGNGTADEPYLISSDADWTTFASNVSNGTSYSGQTVKLTADIDPVVDGGHEQPRAKEAGGWSYEWE